MKELVISEQTRAWGEVLDELREDNAKKQKSGLPFIIASIFIWSGIIVVCCMDLEPVMRNFLVFCMSTPLMPISYLAGRILKVDIFDKSNPIGNLGFIFTLNQMLYLLIVMWAFRAVPDKMVMIYAMVFGAHLFPYFWLYKNKYYLVSAIFIPVISLVLGCLFSATVVAGVLAFYELVFAICLAKSGK